jgi:sulfide dehydrogenase cytochrome subunit
MSWKAGAAAVAVALSAPATAGAQEATLLAGACQGCHGVSGAGSSGIPAIAGTMSREDFIAVMQEFRANRREATVMGRIARGYTDAEFNALAAHYAKQETRR